MVSKSQAAEPSKDAVPAIDWSKISDLQEARRVLGNVAKASDVLGDGSEFLSDKNVLVGVPFLVLDWHFIVDEKTNNEYVNVLIMGVDGSKARFNDGGTGVHDQLKKVSEEIGKIGIDVKNGLRRSDYETEVNGKTQKATTYYFSV